MIRYLLVLTLLMSSAASLLAEHQVNVNFVYGGKTYRLPEQKRVLKTIYGPTWEKSVAWRTYQKCQEEETRAHITRIQSIRGNDVNINIRYDDPNRIHPGEKIFLSEDLGYETIQPGESIDGMLRRKFFGGRKASELNAEEIEKLNWARDLVISRNPDRFNVHPHRELGTDNVNIPHDLSKFEQYNDDTGLAALIVHEVAHTADKTMPDSSYGGDGNHTFNEVTTENMAFIEGWAIYNQALVNPRDRERLFETYKNISHENANSTVDNPSYVMHFGGVSFEDRVATEGIVAATLVSIDDNGKNREALHNSFKATNGETSSTFDMLDHYIANASPAEAKRAIMMIDLNTQFTADESFFDKYGEAGKAYLAERAELEKRWVRCKHHGCSLERFIQGLNDPANFPLDEFDKPIPEGESYTAADGSFIMSVKGSSDGKEPLEDMDLLDTPESEE